MTSPPSCSCPPPSVLAFWHRPRYSAGKHG